MLRTWKASKAMRWGPEQRGVLGSLRMEGPRVDWKTRKEILGFHMQSQKGQQEEDSTTDVTEDQNVLLLVISAMKVSKGKRNYPICSRVPNVIALTSSSPISCNGRKSGSDGGGDFDGKSTKAKVRCPATNFESMAPSWYLRESSASGGQVVFEEIC